MTRPGASSSGQGRRSTSTYDPPNLIQTTLSFTPYTPPAPHATSHPYARPHVHGSKSQHAPRQSNRPNATPTSFETIMAGKASKVQERRARAEVGMQARTPPSVSSHYPYHPSSGVAVSSSPFSSHERIATPFAEHYEAEVEDEDEDFDEDAQMARAMMDDIDSGRYEFTEPLSMKKTNGDSYYSMGRERQPDPILPSHSRTVIRRTNPRQELYTQAPHHPLSFSPAVPRPAPQTFHHESRAASEQWQPLEPKPSRKRQYEETDANTHQNFKPSMAEQSKSYQINHLRPPVAQHRDIQEPSYHPVAYDNHIPHSDRFASGQHPVHPTRQPHDGPQHTWVRHDQNQRDRVLDSRFKPSSNVARTLDHSRGLSAAVTSYGDLIADTDAAPTHYSKVAKTTAQKRIVQSTPKAPAIPYASSKPSIRVKSEPAPFPMLELTSVRAESHESDRSSAASASREDDTQNENDDDSLQEQIEETMRGVDLHDDDWNEVADPSPAREACKDSDASTNVKNEGESLESQGSPQTEEQDREEDKESHDDQLIEHLIEDRDEEDLISKDMASPSPTNGSEAANERPRWVTAPAASAAPASLSLGTTQDATEFFGESFDPITRTLRIGFDSRLVDLDLKIDDLYDSKQFLKRYTQAIETLILEDLPDLPTMHMLKKHCDAHHMKHLFPNVKHLVFAGSAQSRFVQIVCTNSIKQVRKYIKDFAQLCSPQTLCSDYALGAQHNERIEDALKRLKTAWPQLKRCTIHKALDDLPWTMRGIEHRVIYHPTSFPFSSSDPKALSRWMLREPSLEDKQAIDDQEEEVPEKTVKYKYGDLEKSLKRLLPGLKGAARPSWTVDIPPISQEEENSLYSQLMELYNMIPEAQTIMQIRDDSGQLVQRKPVFDIHVRKEDHAKCDDCGWESGDICRVKTGDQW